MKLISPINNQDLNSYWGWFFAWGVALVLLGLVAISAATVTTLLSVILIGVLILISGVIILIDTFTFWWGKWTGFALHLLMGLLYFWVGLMLINNPDEGSISLTIFLGLLYLVVGITRVIFSLGFRVGRWQWTFLNGLLTLLLGILILTSLPASGLFIIGLFVGIDLVFSGITYIMGALYAKKLS